MVWEISEARVGHSLFPSPYLVIISRYERVLNARAIRNLFPAYKLFRGFFVHWIKMQIYCCGPNNNIAITRRYCIQFRFRFSPCYWLERSYTRSLHDIRSIHDLNLSQYLLYLYFHMCIYVVFHSSLISSGIVSQANSMTCILITISKALELIN